MNNSELAMVCLRSANRSRLAAIQSTTDEDRSYWERSAATWLGLFWSVVYGTYGEA